MINDTNFWYGYYIGLGCGLGFATVVVFLLYKQLKSYLNKMKGGG